MTKLLNENDRKVLKKFQRDEATALLIYSKLSTLIKKKPNADILAEVADEERRHYTTLKEYTEAEPPPRRLYALFVILTARLLGFTFAVKLMEKVENATQASYSKEIAKYPCLDAIMKEEEEHEKKLIGMLQEELLEYVGSMVLGFNDALVELTGALAGFTFAFQNTRLIALSGLITGIAASLSMASSEYLSHRAEGKDKRAVKASLITGISYIITVILLVLPYLLLTNYLLALICTMLIGVVIIVIFNFYISVARDFSFRKNAFEMTVLSLGVAGISFGIGILARKILGVEI